MFGRIGQTVVLSLFLCLTIAAQERNTDYQYALIEAVKQKNLGNLPGAVELYKMVLEENDSVAVAHYELGTLYALAGSYNLALDHLEKAYEIDPQTKWYFNTYIEVLLIQKEYKKAEKLLKNKREKDPDNEDYHYRLANIAFLEGKSGKAIRILERMERKWGFSDKVTLLKASIYEERENYDKALTEIERILQIFPESIELKIVAAEMAMKNSKSELAAEYYMGVFELDSMNVYALTNLTDYYRKKGNISESLFFLNKSFESDEIDYQRKIAIMEFYISDTAMVREYRPLLKNLVETMLKKHGGQSEIRLLATEFFIRSGDYDEALNTMIPVLNKEEHRYGLWKQGMLLASAADRNRDMLWIAESASVLFPDSLEIIYFKGIAHYELQQYKELLSILSNDMVQKAEDHEMVSHMNMLVAESLYQIGEYQQSDSIFRKIIESEPDNYMVMNNFSYYLSLRGESLESAKVMSRKTIENNPENGTFLDTYAWVLFKLGEYEEAEVYIMKALKFGGESSPVINEHAADIFYSNGNEEMARMHYQKAIELGGESERILEKMENLYKHE